jgi:hypothetical protein
MRKFISLFVISLFLVSQIGTAAEAASAKKKAGAKREFTAEQRAKIMEQARKLCKDKMGPTSTVYQLEIKNSSFSVRCSAY